MFKTTATKKMISPPVVINDTKSKHKVELEAVMNGYFTFEKTKEETKAALTDLSNKISKS
jgi:hypothetical protein